LKRFTSLAQAHSAHYNNVKLELQVGPINYLICNARETKSVHFVVSAIVVENFYTKNKCINTIDQSLHYTAIIFNCHHNNHSGITYKGKSFTILVK